ncbi:MAG: HAMP domain-containing sensor histidine kinase [Candidatus Paceibacterota bacterium]
MSKKLALFSTAPVICHSFSTPVTNILLNTQIAVQALPREARELSDIYLQRVLLNANYLNSALQTTDSIAPSSFSPKHALLELLALNEGTKLKQQLVSRLPVANNFKLSGNKLFFQEIVACLLNNAYESYPQEKINKPIFLNFNLKNKFCVLSVTDGGQGMNWVKQKLSTTQFYSTKQNHSGLGLYFVKKALEEKFGGKLTLSSRPNKGTTITLNFPL